jgi:hypothetical protein
MTQAHKAGRKAGQSARQKHAEKKGAAQHGWRLQAFTLCCSCQSERDLPGRIVLRQLRALTGGRIAAVHNTGRLAQSRAERMNAAKLQRCSLPCVPGKGASARHEWCVRI